MGECVLINWEYVELKSRSTRDRSRLDDAKQHLDNDIPIVRVALGAQSPPFVRDLHRLYKKVDRSEVEERQDNPGALGPRRGTIGSTSIMVLGGRLWRCSEGRFDGAHSAP